MDTIDKLETKIEMQQQAWRDLNEELSAVIDQRDQLRDALERTLCNFEKILEQRPVRDATETIAEARRALKETEES